MGKEEAYWEWTIFPQQLSPTGTVPVTTPQYFAVHRSYSIIFSAIRILKLLIS